MIAMNRTTGIVLLLGLITVCGAPVAWGQSAVRLSEPDSRATVWAAIDSDSLHPGQQALVAVVIDIKQGFHAQSHTPFDENLIRLEVSMGSADAVEFAAPQYPPGEIVEYATLGRLSVYGGRTVVYVPFTVSPSASPGPLQFDGTVSYQICDDDNCFEPQIKPFQVQTQIVPASEPISPANTELFADFGKAQPLDAASRPLTVNGPVSFFGFMLDLGKFSAAIVLGLAFLVGIIMNVMPCVLPVLPLKAIGFYEVAQHSRSRSILLALVFGLGIVSTFAVLAVLVLVLKTFDWGEQFSNPWFIWTIAFILGAMGVGLLGAFSVNLPAAVYSITPRHDTVGGNYLFGILAAILSTPCTAPLFPALLLWASTQPMVLGISSMLMVGVGMASPYVLLSAFPEMARRFPRTGPSAELVKQMLGFLLIGAAVYFAGGYLIEGSAFYWAVFAVIVWAMVYLVIRTVQLTQRSAAVLITTGLAIAVVGLSLRFVLRMNGLEASSAALTTAGAIRWQSYTPEALEQARQSDQISLVKFTANWCGNCQYIEATVFKDPAVIDALRRLDVATFKVDLTHENRDGRALLRQFSPAGSIPFTAIWLPKQEAPMTFASIYGSVDLLTALNQVDSPRELASPALAETP